MKIIRGSVGYHENDVLGILTILKGSGPYTGYWALPGGKIESGETSEQACLREFKEETNLDAKILRKIGQVNFRDDRDDYRNLIYHADVWQCKVDNLQYWYLRRGGDARNIRWTDERHILSENVAYPVREFYKRMSGRSKESQIFVDLSKLI
jgi:8-oxo-dGTP pyrophosphatase MutT (NUDIX family)